MSTSYDLDWESAEKLRDAWAHLTLLATGQQPATSNAEAAQGLAEAYTDLFEEEISESRLPTRSGKNVA